MKSPSFAVALLLSAMAVSAIRADWKPAQGPLMTRWAKDVSPNEVLPEYPRPQMVRSKWQNLNGLWQFAIAKPNEEPPLNKKLDEQILVPFPVESALSGVMKHAERIWYRRTFTVPKDWAGQHVLLHFGAVDWEAKVWVNGKELGVHRGGYDPFSFDVTDALKGDGEQELIVGVWDPTDAGTQPRGKQVNKPGGIFYTAVTGIWQTVWLEPVSKLSIQSLEILPDVDAGTVMITVKTRGNKGKNLHALYEIRSKGEPVLSNMTGAPDDSIIFALSGNKQDVKLWSPESPFLYDLKVSLLEDAKVLDTVESYFGMRKIAVVKDEKGVPRIQLNNKTIFQVGPLDQGWWPDGLYTAPTDEALKYDVEITKKFGFNMTRKHVKVEPARWYYWCDTLGLLVWQDMPSGDASTKDKEKEIKRTSESAKQYEKELAAMIENLHNYPCIVMWVVFNEGWGQFDTKRITEWTKKTDPTRLVNNASGWNDMNVGDVHDIHVYPGPAAPPIGEKRAGVLGEFGGLGLGVDGHTWSKKTWGYRGTADKEDLTRKYERLLAGVWKLKDEKGLNAAVYTQITDVETEANGLLTYDREIIKLDLDRAAAVNKGDVSKILVPRVLVASSQEKPQTWRYTFEKPAMDWYKPEFKVADWKEGPGGFGTKGTPGAVVRTEWKTDDIWIRREFEIDEDDLGEILLTMHHDEDAEVYLNGVLAAKVAGYIANYEEFPLTKEGRAALKKGKNVLAVHCHQTTGGQYIDVGLLEMKKPQSR
jgi:Glycosyl hydrolases family 2, sugar binding domain/Glycosyl hydrolases family 2, TIM barrel domain/Glycosyl hydrolases family 2